MASSLRLGAGAAALERGPLYYYHGLLVLLCHKHALPPLAPQVGQKGSLATRARALRIRCVVIEVYGVHQ